MHRFILRHLSRHLWRLSALFVWLASYALPAAAASASLGMDVIAANEQHGTITLFFPSTSPNAPLTRGPFTFNASWQGEVLAANHHLIVFSHGSGGAPWPLTDLAHTLVDAGYVVAVPEHKGDNNRDMSLQGPASWKRRPAEVSAAIDAVAADARFSATLNTKTVGVFGLSAGGITALITAGARWSPALFQKHCLANLEEDFPSCVGLIVSLSGGWFDNVKLAAARLVHRLRFNDATLYQHDDTRIRAVVSAVPMAVPIDMTSLSQPRAAIGLIEARKDAWLLPKFHIDAVRAACPRCEVIADLPEAGHGSLFSPWPEELAKNLTPLLVNPPAFDRTELIAVYAGITKFFNTHLLNAQ
jgi:predicted dienelactone hydrolase